jgi:hypothetical protein
MPAKINMFISNGNPPPAMIQQMNVASLGGAPHMASLKAPSAINAPMISRVHNVKAGCGSCGRH